MESAVGSNIYWYFSNKLLCNYLYCYFGKKIIVFSAVIFSKTKTFSCFFKYILV